MKKKNLQKLCVLSSLSMIAGNTLPTMAYDLDSQGSSVEKVTYKDVGKAGLSDATVFAELDSVYKVTIPKTVVLSGATKDAKYYVKVEGDIAGYEEVEVVPDENFRLYAKNKDSQIADISQDKLVWTVDDFDTDANGHIDASKITAGKWTGTFNFNINLNTRTKVAGDIVIPEFLSDDYKLIITSLKQKPAGLYDRKGDPIALFDDILVNHVVDTNVLYGPENVPEGQESIATIIEEEYPETVFVKIPESVTTIKTGGIDVPEVEYVYIPGGVEEIEDDGLGGGLIYVDIPEGTRVGKNQPEKPHYYGGKEVKVIPVDLEKGDAEITLTKGYVYMIEALYNFTNDVTGQSTIVSSNPSVVEYFPIYYLDAKEVGQCVISGDYNAQTGLRHAQIKINVIDGAEKSVPEEPVTEETQTLAAGLYDENDNLIKSWDELTAMGLDIEKDYANFKGEGGGHKIIASNGLGGKLVIPNTITRIGNNAFTSAYTLTSVILPNSITNIGENAFDSCKITSITIPNSVTSIGKNAFQYCESLESATIPNSVTSIGESAFSSCKSLKKINSNVDGECILPNSITDIGKAAFYNCAFKMVTVPNSIKEIKYQTFQSCRLLESVTIPNSVTTIGQAAFQYCESLKSINSNKDECILPNSVTAIGYGAFSGCKSIKSIKMSNSITEFKGAFSNCTSLESINSDVKGKFVLPSSLKAIDNYTFSNCTSLESIVIPSATQFIGQNAFNNCTNLKSMKFDYTVEWYTSPNRENQDWSKITAIDVSNASRNAEMAKKDYLNLFWFNYNQIYNK